jgi:hypothetical protein
MPFRRRAIERSGSETDLFFLRLGDKCRWRRILLGFTSLILLFIVSCAPKEEKELQPPPGAIPQEKFTSVMLDIQLIEGMKVHKLGPRVDRGIDMSSLYSEIFEKHKITREEFELTYGFYRSHPDKMEVIYEAVLDSLTTLEVEVKKEYQQETQLPDSIIGKMGRNPAMIDE